MIDNVPSVLRYCLILLPTWMTWVSFVRHHKAGGRICRASVITLPDHKWITIDEGLNSRGIEKRGPRQVCNAIYKICAAVRRPITSYAVPRYIGDFLSSNASGYHAVEC